MYEAVVQASFSAAHRLRGYGGKCESPHGHNWRVEATFRAEQLDKAGMVVDFRILKEKLNQVLGELDHADLNELTYFKKTNPTSENIAKYIYEKLKSEIHKICVWETDSSCATYSE